MSWLSELAGKAEGLLNKLDQNAASALLLASEAKTSGNKIPIDCNENEVNQQVRLLLSSQAPAPSSLYRLKEPLTNQQRVKEASAITEDELMQLLNNPSGLDSLSDCSYPCQSTEGTPDICGDQVVPIEEHHQSDVENGIHECDNLMTAATGADNDQESQLLPAVGLNETNASNEVIPNEDGETIQPKTDCSQGSPVDGTLSKCDYDHCEDQPFCQRLETEVQLLKQVNETLKRDLQQQIGLAQEAQQRQLATSAELDQVVKELHDYKMKATKILMQKDKLIASKDWSPNGNDGNTFKTDLDMTRMERDSYRDESVQLADKVQQLDKELVDLKAQTALQMDSYQKCQMESSKKLQQVTSKAAFFKLELQKREAEIGILQDDLVRQNARLRDLDDAQQRLLKENEELKLSVLPVGDKRSEAAITAHYEVRIESLTKNLLAKQALLESVKADNMALSLRIDKLKQDDSAPHFAKNSSVETVESAVVSSTRPGLKHGSLSSIHRMLAVVMRRPWIRTIFFLYIVLLHVWVFFILTTVKLD